MWLEEKKEEWAFEISTFLTWPCWPNKRGDLLGRHILCSTGCIRQGTSTVALLWKLNYARTCPRFGGACYKLAMSLGKGLYGKWEMGGPLVSVLISGYHTLHVSEKRQTKICENVT